MIRLPQLVVCPSCGATFTRDELLIGGDRSFPVIVTVREVVWCPSCRREYPGAQGEP